MPLHPFTVVPVATMAVLAAGAGTASAHVRVSSADAAPGGYGEMTFRVPNESVRLTVRKLVGTAARPTGVRSAATVGEVRAVTWASRP